MRFKREKNVPQQQQQQSIEKERRIYSKQEYHTPEKSSKKHEVISSDKVSSSGKVRRSRKDRMSDKKGIFIWLNFFWNFQDDVARNLFLTSLISESERDFRTTTVKEDFPYYREVDSETVSERLDRYSLQESESQHSLKSQDYENKYGSGKQNYYASTKSSEKRNYLSQQSDLYENKYGSVGHNYYASTKSSEKKKYLSQQSDLQNYTTAPLSKGIFQIFYIT